MKNVALVKANNASYFRVLRKKAVGLVWVCEEVSSVVLKQISEFQVFKSSVGALEVVLEVFVPLLISLYMRRWSLLGSFFHMINVSQDHLQGYCLHC